MAVASPRRDAGGSPESEQPLDGQALGLLETFGLVAAIEGADAMLKAARVTLVRQERTDAALITCLIAGETAAVRQAVDAGRAAAERVGKVVSAHVIPRPAPDVWADLVPPARRAPAGPSAPSSAPRAPRLVRLPSPSERPAVAPVGDWDRLTVRQLRALARERNDPAFTGRAIASASKEALVAFLGRR